MTLLELQRQMFQDVRRPLTADFNMHQRADDGSGMQEVSAAYITPNALLTSFERLEIYNRQYWFRLIEAVSQDFPALRAVLGTKRFDALILAYLREHASISWTLRDMGARLPGWLVGQLELTGKRHRLAVDVAALEWAYVEAFDRKHKAPLSADDLRNLGPETRIALQPHIQLLELAYPVDELVLAVHKEIPEMDIVSNAVVHSTQQTIPILPRMRKGQIRLAVHRYDDSVYYRRLDHEEFVLLSALGAGLTIAEAIFEAFTESRLNPEQQAATIQRSFAHAAELGWFCLPSEVIHRGYRPT